MFACALSPDQRNPVKGVIGIVHGMGEHTDLYLHVAEMFNEHGFAVLMFDQRGHGHTSGQRGHAPSYEHLLEGVDLLLFEAERRYPGIPRFLYGHSMGGNVTLNYLLRRKPDISGAISTGPWLKLAFEPPLIQVAIGGILQWVYPKYSNNRPMKPDNLTTDPEMIKRIQEDPIRHGHITAKYFFGVMRAGRWALQHASELSVPLLLMHGGDDKVTSIQASKQFVQLAGERCEFREWPEFKHELHNERNRANVFAVMAEWMNRRIGIDEFSKQ
jgi:alpha-beta hydrolase superfamily lysophospholipase